MLYKIQHDPRTGALYTRYLTRWQDEIGDLLTLYEDYDTTSQFGAFGHQDYPGQPAPASPKFAALDKVLTALAAPAASLKAAVAVDKAAPAGTRFFIFKQDYGAIAFAGTGYDDTAARKGWVGAKVSGVADAGAVPAGLCATVSSYPYFVDRCTAIAAAVKPLADSEPDCTIGKALESNGATRFLIYRWRAAKAGTATYRLSEDPTAPAYAVMVPGICQEKQKPIPPSVGS